MIAVAGASKCGCGGPKPAGAGCSCREQTKSDCACSQKRKPPGSATCCKAGGSCTCQNGLRSPPPHSKPDVDPIHVGLLGAPLARRSEDLDAPPVVVPRFSVICCDPPHEELRPPKSFLDCRWYLLTSGGMGAWPWVAEPPQSANLEPERQERFEDQPVRLDTFEDRPPIPLVATSDESAASCHPGRRVTVARFARASVCDQAGHTIPTGVQPPLAPGQQEARGKGGGEAFTPCYCECTCPLGWFGSGGRSTFDPGAAGTVVDDQREDPRGPVRIIGNEPVEPPMIDPIPPRDPRGDRRGAVRIIGNEPPLPPTLDPWPPGLLPPDAPPENVAEALCEWCGGLRAAPGAASPPRPKAPGDLAARTGSGLEPPQFAAPPAPARPAELAELGTHSLGGATPLAPPVHSDGARFLSPAGVLAEHGAPRRAQR